LIANLSVCYNIFEQYGIVLVYATGFKLFFIDFVDAFVIVRNVFVYFNNFTWLIWCVW